MNETFGTGLTSKKRQRTLRIIEEMDPEEVQELSRQTGLEPIKAARVLLYRRILEEQAAE